MIVIECKIQWIFVGILFSEEFSGHRFHFDVLHQKKKARAG